MRMKTENNKSSAGLLMGNVKEEFGELTKLSKGVFVIYKGKLNVASTVYIDSNIYKKKLCKLCFDISHAAYIGYIHPNLKNVNME